MLSPRTYLGIGVSAGGIVLGADVADWLNVLPDIPESLTVLASVGAGCCITIGVLARRIESLFTIGRRVEQSMHRPVPGPPKPPGHHAQVFHMAEGARGRAPVPYRRRHQE